MTKLSHTHRIQAKPEQIWPALADVGYVHHWHPKVKASPVLSDHAEGLGATRRCEFYDGTSVVEEVVAVSPERFVSVRLSEFSMPLNHADGTISLTPVDAGTTDVTIAFEYDTKFGPIGWLMDRVMMRNMMCGMFKEVLEGLDVHVTTGRYVGEGGATEGRPMASVAA